jgi:hypothetical protein
LSSNSFPASSPFLPPFVSISVHPWLNYLLWLRLCRAVLSLA